MFCPIFMRSRISAYSTCSLHYKYSTSTVRFSTVLVVYTTSTVMRHNATTREVAAHLDVSFWRHAFMFGC